METFNNLDKYNHYLRQLLSGLIQTNRNLITWQFSPTKFRQDDEVRDARVKLREHIGILPFHYRKDKHL